MSENLFGLTVAADKGLDDLQCQRLLSENRKYQEVMLQYRCALKALESRLEILNEEFSLQHDRNPIESMKSRLKSPSSIMNPGAPCVKRTWIQKCICRSGAGTPGWRFPNRKLSKPGGSRSI